MSPIRRGGIYYLYVARQSGGWALRTTGTSDKRVYTLMKALLARLKAERRWSLLAAVIDGPLTIGQLYDADRVHGLDVLEASLSAQALAPHITAYLDHLKARGKAARHVENVKRQLTKFREVATTTADLRPAVVTPWLASLTGSPGTRRQYLFAVTGLARYLMSIDVLADYPLAKVKAPDKNPARMRYESAANDERIVQASPGYLQGLFAFVKGTGVDLSVALDTPAREIRLGAGTARLKGTKTAQRDVHEALIEPWAVPYIATALRDVLPNARPWATISRHVAYYHHARSCEAVGVEDYTLKDSRHSVGVRMAQAGYTIHEIAEQLGNSPEICARVYTRFIPKMAHHVTPRVIEATHA